MRKVRRVKQHLGYLCLSQKEGAARCGMTQQEFSRIVNGTEKYVGEKRGRRIADALGWDGPWQELFEEIEVPL